MPWRRGSLNVDDEGEPTQETVLIENGILKNYLSDKLSSRLMGIADTGNGRRESYEHIPMPRMTNTYMLAGQDNPKTLFVPSSAASTPSTSAEARSISPTENSFSAPAKPT